jgi:hypothetical protein
MAKRAKPSEAQIQEALQTAGTVSGAAKALGIPRTTLSSWLHDNQGEEATERAAKRKLTDAVSVSGSLEERDLKKPEELLSEHGLEDSEWDVLKVDLSKRDAGTAKDPKVSRTISVSIAPKIELPEPAMAGEKTVFRARPKRSKKAKTEPRLYVILGDEQAPNGLDEPLHELVLQFLRDVGPDELVHIGDLGDFESVSSYQQLNPGQWSNSVQECIDSSYRILANYMANLPEGTRARYLIGNHEVRLQRYLLNQAKEVFGIARAEEAGNSVLDLAYLLRLEELGVELVTSDLGTYPHPMIELAPRLVATHGDVARRKSGTSPHAAMEHLEAGVIHGHTHRAAIVSRTVHTLKGSYTLQGAEIGCLCKPNGLGYTSSRSTDWQQGFATVAVWPDGHYQIDLASYQNGVLVWRGERWQ